MPLMLLLRGMNALFGKQISDVDYAAEAQIPSDSIEGLSVHHESTSLAQISELLESIGGQISGELVRHNNGSTLDQNDFEDIEKDMEEQNV